jgi:hypothetical protein
MARGSGIAELVADRIVVGEYSSAQITSAGVGAEPLGDHRARQAGADYYIVGDS